MSIVMVYWKVNDVGIKVDGKRVMRRGVPELYIIVDPRGKNALDASPTDTTASESRLSMFILTSVTPWMFCSHRPP